MGRYAFLLHVNELNSPQKSKIRAYLFSLKKCPHSMHDEFLITRKESKSNLQRTESMANLKQSTVHYYPTTYTITTCTVVRTTQMQLLRHFLILVFFNIIYPMLKGQCNQIVQIPQGSLFGCLFLCVVVSKIVIVELSNRHTALHF